MTDHVAELIDPQFWRMPLEDRMARFAELREVDAFLPASFDNPMSGLTEAFCVTTRFAELVEISRRPEDFCSGRGAVSIPDLPAEALEFFGSFINMDDPRHARQRGIVSRSFTPRQLASVLESVETICAEVIDDMCERGEVDLVTALSQPFPLLVICDMMGIPRSEFRTVLEATNVILGAGDPDMLGGRDPMTAMFESGHAALDADERARRGPPQGSARRPHVRARERAERRGHPGADTRSRRSSSCSRSRGTTRLALRSAAACTCSRRIPINAECGRTISTA